jgi:hypothetical protein
MILLEHVQTHQLCVLCVCVCLAGLEDWTAVKPCRHIVFE